MDADELQDICDDIENDYDENDDEMYEDDISFLSDNDMDESNDSGFAVNESSTDTSVGDARHDDKEDVDAFLENTWREVQMEVEADLTAFEAQIKTNDGASTEDVCTTITAVEAIESSPSDVKPDNMINGMENNMEAQDISGEMLTSPTEYKDDDFHGTGGEDQASNTVPENFSSSPNVKEPKREPTSFGSWIPDSYLPPDSGWLLKRCSSNKTFITSPDGKLFDSRRNVLKHMKHEKYFPQYFAVMLEGLRQEQGWMEDVRLPPDWLYKPKSQKQHGFEYLDADFNLMVNTSRARTQIVENYDQNVVSSFDNFTLFLKKSPGRIVRPITNNIREELIGEMKNYKNKKIIEREHKEQPIDEESVPSGFTIDMTSGEIVSVTGRRFSCRREAYQVMCSENAGWVHQIIS